MHSYMDIQQSGAGKPSAVGPAGDIISGGYEAPVPEESAEEQGGSRLGLLSRLVSIISR